ncbi:hypothetical protein Scep_018493 [Stephania cephalantha]|uniref:Uncharacterized protein n=1 Tax=Stephania cephalantha TaxID=152367 RepID=A0AAP0I915_9MAGN
MATTTTTTTVFSSAIASCGVVNHQYPRLVLARKGNKSASAMVFSSSKYALKQLSLHTIRSSTSTRSLQCKSHTTSKEGTVHSSTANSGSHSNSWKNWILGTLLSLILPFWKHKWAPLLAIKNEVDKVIGTIDVVTEVVEKVAEGVEKAAEEVAQRLPEGGKLQEAVLVVEKIAKKVHEDAHATDEFIHKVEDVGDDIEKGVEAIVEAIDQHDDQTEEIKQEEDQTVAEVTEEVEVIKVEAVSTDVKEENVESKKTI